MFWSLSFDNGCLVWIGKCVTPGWLKVCTKGKKHEYRNLQSSCSFKSINAHGLDLVDRWPFEMFALILLFIVNMTTVNACYVTFYLLYGDAYFISIHMYSY